MKKNNKKISKIIAPVALATGCLGVIPATSCSMYSSVKHIAPYLHEITYDDYTYDKDETTIQEAEAFGCSSVRNGNFYGRNFDYVFNDTPEFVVRVKANKKKNRHESIGIATHFGLRESKLLKNKYDKQLELIPNLTLDGINDAGVICSHNVVDMEDIGEVAEGTNPGAERLHMLFIPRYVLDNASSAKEAVELIQKRNICGNLNNHYYLHVMIADANDTYVVEFFDNDHDGKMNVVIDKKDGSEGKEPIMTNYYVNNKHPQTGDPYFNNKHKMGDERYEILKGGYSTSGSFEGMENLLKKVMFSNACRYFHNVAPFGVTISGVPGAGDVTGDLTSEWYSELFTDDVIKSVTQYSEIEPILNSFNRFKQDYWIARMMDFRNPPNPGFWQTTHNSTYDIENKHLRVVVQEQYEEQFDYYL